MRGCVTHFCQSIGKTILEVVFILPLQGNNMSSKPAKRQAIVNFDYDCEKIHVRKNVDFEIEIITTMLFSC